MWGKKNPTQNVQFTHCVWNWGYFSIWNKSNIKIPIAPWFKWNWAFGWHKGVWVEHHEEIISLAVNRWKGRWMIFLMHAARLWLIKKLWCSPASRPETARPITNRMWLNKGTRTTKIYIALTLQGKRNTVKLAFISCEAAVDAAYVTLLTLPTHPSPHPAAQLLGGRHLWVYGIDLPSKYGTSLVNINTFYLECRGLRIIMFWLCLWQDFL